MTMDPIFQIGKSSLTPEFVKAISEVLEARELIKISVLQNCMDDPKELAAVVAERTHAEVVQLIGKKIVLYREGKDDKKKIMDVLLDQDAVIFSAPTYALMPSSLFLKFMHRNLAYETAFLTKIGAIAPRDRVGALIAVGGSTRSWQSMALECMQATTFSSSFKIIDMFMATMVPAPAQVLLHEEKTERAKTPHEPYVSFVNL